MKNKEENWGILIALVIMGLWASSLGFLFSLDVSNIQVLLGLSATLWQTFLYTGLFITAHDAMHGVICPKNRRINNFVGSLALYFYALFSYKKLLVKHWIHHRHPASKVDPDFHDGEHRNFFSWYFHFIKGYWSWAQVIGLVVVFHLANHVLHVSEVNLTLFWILPSLLSSIQLFYFGTFLPHREPEGGYRDPHRAQTSPLPTFWSLITCYHFGYHREHHEYPQAPWWKLPEVYRVHTNS